MFINTHQSKEVNMSKKREEEPNPLLKELLHALNEYHANKSPEALKTIGNTIDQGVNCLENLYFGQTPFSLAAQYGLPEVVELMISKNVNPTGTNSLGVIELPEGGEECYAASALHVAVTNNQSKVAKVLMQRLGCTFNANNKFSPLHLAASQKNHNLFNTLVEGGCDPHAQDFVMGKTAYQWASEYGGENFNHFNFDGAKE